MCKDVPLQIDSRSYLDKIKPLLAKPEYTAFGNVEHQLLPLARVRSAEGAVFDLRHELACRPLFQNSQLTVSRLDAELARVERADEHDCLGILADVDEPAGSREALAEAADIEISLPVGLR